MNGYLMIIGLLLLYIIYLHFQLWFAKELLRATRPTVQVSNNNRGRASEPRGCGAFAFLVVALLVVVPLYLILSAT